MTTPSEMTPESSKNDELIDAGFDHNFRLSQEKVVDVDTGVQYEPETVRVVQEIRSEGVSDPGDESIQLALEAPDGVKGTVVVAYGPSSEHSDVVRRLGADHVRA